jgi:hypothetical protein
MRSALKVFMQSLKNSILNASEMLQMYFRPFQKPVTDRILIVQIEDFNQGRYGFQLINYLHLAGYHIAFYKSGAFLYNLHGYDRLLFKLPGVSFFKKKIINTQKQVDFLFLTNNGNVKAPVACNITYELSLDYFSKKNDSAPSVLRLPFFIHPRMNQYLPIKKQKRRNRILFYGCDDALYDSELIKNWFQLMSRSEVYRIIEKSGLDFISPDSYELLEQQLNNPEVTNAFFFLNSSEVWIPGQRWMNIISSFDFFISTPGVSMPHSHNVIEAMSVGTIPIIQYGHWFNPSLTDLVNCVSYNSISDLISIINSVSGLSNERVLQLRDGVTQYYNDHINPSNFSKRLNMLDSNHIKLYFNAEEISLSMLNKI